MSVATKRRYMMNKLEREMYSPVEGDSIAQVVGARGNNLHEVLDERGEAYLVSMPSKFRKAVWIRKGQFVVVRPIEEGDKVRAEIEHVLDTENILHIHTAGKWPARFEEEAKLLTRELNRGQEEQTAEGGGAKMTKSLIDEDMLPPEEESESEEEEGEGEEGDDEGESEEGEDDEEADEEDEEEQSTYNPNRSKAPESAKRAE